jgi:hypothetical protein
MRLSYVLACLLTFPIAVIAAEPCTVIHGRAHYYGGDGQLRIWHIGTHHEFEPDDTSWDRVMGWLTAGTKKGDSEKFASPESNLMLFGDFTVCPVEPFKQASIQKAKIIGIKNRHYVRLQE